MIQNVVASIGYRLNEHVMNALSLSDEAVIISSLVDLKGNINPDIENKISMFLINIEEERTAKNGHFQSSPGMNPPTTVNLYLFQCLTKVSQCLQALYWRVLLIIFLRSWTTRVCLK